MPTFHFEIENVMKNDPRGLDAGVHQATFPYNDSA